MCTSQELKKVWKHQEPTLCKPQIHRRKVYESINVLNLIFYQICTPTLPTVTDQKIQAQLIHHRLQVKSRCFQCWAWLRDPNWWSRLNLQQDNNNSKWFQRSSSLKKIEKPWKLEFVFWCSDTWDNLKKWKQLKKILKNLKCSEVEFVFWTTLTPGKSGSLFHPRQDRLTNQSNRYEAPMGEMCFYRKIQGEEKLKRTLESGF